MSTLAYRSGTVAVTNGSPTVTGTGTSWASQVLPGDLFTLDGTRVVEVLSVASNTSLTLAVNWAGSTASGQTYAISRVSSGWSQAATAALKVAALVDAVRTLPVPSGGDALKPVRANSGGTAFEFYSPIVIPRERLTANRTYWVRADGNDANDGSANSSGAAFRQFQKAIDTVAGLDLGAFSVTIAGGAAGTFDPLTLRPLTGSGSCIMVGDTATPSNYLISGGAANAITAQNVRNYDLTGLKLQSTSAGGLVATGSALITRVMEYGSIASGFTHIQVSNNASLLEAGNKRITAGASAHIYASDGGVVVGSGNTVTLVGTPAWALAGVYAARGGNVFLPFYTYSGAATGQRFLATMNGAIETFTSGAADTLPGSSAGATSLGGQYN